MTEPDTKENRAGSTPALVISEIYRSLLGESRWTGRVCQVVRLTGCHRRCRYCDSPHAFTGGEKRALPDLLAELLADPVPLVLVTGGEPLLQPAVVDLLRALVAAGREVVLETSGTRGALPLAAVPAGVHRVVDVKTPGSGVPAAEVAWDQFTVLGPDDELKFVCCDRADYTWARDLVRAGNRWPAAVPVVFSPAHGMLDPGELADWIVADALPVRCQVQLHKVLWPGRPAC